MLEYSQALRERKEQIKEEKKKEKPRVVNRDWNEFLLTLPKKRHVTFNF